MNYSDVMHMFYSFQKLGHEKVSSIFFYALAAAAINNVVKHTLGYVLHYYKEEIFDWFPIRFGNGSVFSKVYYLDNIFVV